MVGYQPGYGEAADCWPQGANSSYMKMRVFGDGGGQERFGALSPLQWARSGQVRPRVRQRQAVGS